MSSPRTVCIIRISQPTQAHFKIIKHLLDYWFILFILSCLLLVGRFGPMCIVLYPDSRLVVLARGAVKGPVQAEKLFSRRVRSVTWSQYRAKRRDKPQSHFISVFSLPYFHQVKYFHRSMKLTSHTFTFPSWCRKESI